MTATPTSGAISRSLARETMGFRHQDPSNPPLCRRCNVVTVPLRNVSPDETVETWVALSPFCTACVKAIRHEEAQTKRQTAENARLEAIRASWANFGPEGEDNTENAYRAVDEARLPYPGIAAKILAWKPAKRGMIVFGDTGQGKTFMLYALAKRLIYNHGVLPTLYSGPGLRQAITAAARHSDSNRRALLLARLVNAPILMIDDLGQAAASDAAEEALWEITEGRTSRGKPMIVTTNFIGERFSQRFLKPETGSAVIRRLSEHCETIRAAQL